ncbi:PDDEXK nuclease domain-containing protein [Fibrobacter sp.]|uniref:PDDEXK nuclease domain-containing protein n=1 Tax=Fibrobacter sp. TaxID=35828 RepID=UPI0025BD028B|nr:PDDEXK nuclease domain-containing protein [Fibrobacter sp.]
MVKNKENIPAKMVESLFNKVANLIEQARARVATAMNVAEVYTKYQIGRYIVEEEQSGKKRAEYGKQVLEGLSERLTAHYGDGWSYSNLRQIRQFFLTYSNLTDTVCQISDTPNFTLSWSHYQVLMRIKNDEERRFYEIEATSGNWSVRELQRQYGSSLYERLALSQDKEKVARLSQVGNVVEKPEDIINNPVTLEFVGLKPDASYSETSLETAIINKLQEFLLELGKGFLFESRQKRFSFDEDNYYVDLVLYNRLLQCYVLVDLKVDKLTHQDLGQMQMYVNYYDRYVKQDFEKPTIGILLCKEKKDALVKLTLPKDANIYASVYELYLPDKKLLQAKVKEWINEFENK